MTSVYCNNNSTDVIVNLGTRAELFITTTIS